MNYSYCITFYVESLCIPFDVRSTFSAYLRKLRLRYKSEEFDPSSVWQPNYAEKGYPEISFFLIYSEKQPTEYEALIKDAISFARSIVDTHEDVVEIGIEKRPHYNLLR